MPPKTEIPQPPGMPEFHLPEALQAEYSNLVRISHSPAEMVLDFSTHPSGMTQAEIVSRIYDARQRQAALVGRWATIWRVHEIRLW